MAEHPFEPFGSEFRRAMEELGARLNQEMKRVQHEIAGAMEGVATELQRVMEEFHREHGGGPNPLKAELKKLDRVDRALRPGRPVAKKKRPRRRPPGSAAAPVRPKPKPKPLKDGAEAPID